ncbi:TOPORS [Lepeophtheirus salmonis]|uniref:E3 ubiquitin-protein ligase Topors n=1 Tax=Lepeophtheirus salmonis TaxID=72036 RepID=A0A7R8CQV7_LEPSM|nr:TOPORS [Lepeophtheirus salmonis]CAF2896949.1 TOPORS [Lepeophtheirus salmonis]
MPISSSVLILWPLECCFIKWILTHISDREGFLSIRRGEQSLKMEVKEEKIYSVTPPPPRISPSAKTPDRSSPRPRKKSEPHPGSPEPNCAICLEKLQNRSVTDSCLHKFCFTCLLEWSKVKAECPLCKSKFSSIIHNIRSDDDYEKYTLPPPPEVQQEAAGSNNDRRFMEELHISLFGHGRSHYNLPTFPTVHQMQSGFGANGPLWRRRRGTASNEFRKSVYERNLWVDPQSLVDITGRYRECSPEWFRNNPAQTHRLVPWLNRELSLICSYDILSQRFMDTIRVYIGERTSHFSHEFYYYARSVYDLIGYDRNAVHRPRPLDLNTSFNSRTSVDSDTDVIFVNEIRTSTGSTIPNYPPLEIDSLSSLSTERVLDENTPSTSGGETSQRKRRPVVPVDDSSDNTEDENVEIVDVLPPRSERTPELVLLSTDEENNTNYLLPNNQTTIVISSDEELASENRVNNSSSSREDRNTRLRHKKGSNRLHSRSSSSSTSSTHPSVQSSTTPKNTNKNDLSSSSSLVEDEYSSDKSTETMAEIPKRKSSDKRKRRKRKRKNESKRALLQVVPPLPILLLIHY